MSRFSKIFDDFNRLRVLIVGDVMLDSYIWGSVDRISPEAPVPVVHVKKRDFRLGGAGNVVVNVHALGAQPIIVSLVGTDEASGKVRSCLRQINVTEDGLVASTERPTPEKTRVIAHHQQVVRVDDETDREASAAEEREILARIEKLLPTCDVVIFQDYDKGTITKNVITQTVSWAREQSKPTVVDPKKRNFLFYERVTLFKPNLKELREGLKMEVQAGNINQVEKAVEALREKLQADGVMATLSEHGVYINFKGKKSKLDAHRRTIADVSGAGDTVIAIASVCVALQLDPETVAALSNLGGGLVCQHVGVVPVDKVELLAEAERCL